MTNNININNNSSDYWLKNSSPTLSSVNTAVPVFPKQESKDTFESRNKKNDNHKTLTISLVIASILAIAGTAIWFNKKGNKGGETKPPSSPPKDIDKIKETEDEIARLTKFNEDIKDVIKAVDLSDFYKRMTDLNNKKGFVRLAGYAKEKKMLTDKVCKPIANEKYGNKLQQVPASVLLYGPMGTGKTIFPRLIADQTDCHYIEFEHQDTPLETFKRIEEEATNAQKRFKEEGKRTIIHLDEVEVLVRHADMANKLKEFMNTSSEEHHCTLFATTNYPDRIDEAFLGHEKLFKMPIPPADKESAAAIVKRYAEVAGTTGQIKYEEIAEHIVKHQPEQAFSNASIKETIKSVAIKAINRHEKISHNDLLEAFKADSPDISKKAMELFAKNIEKLK